MGAGQVGIDAGRLEEARQRVNGWRETRPKLEPMPQELWDAAVALAGEHGVYRVARALRVDYGKLKQLLEAGDAAAARAEADEGSLQSEKTRACGVFSVFVAMTPGKSRHGPGRAVEKTAPASQCVGPRCGRPRRSPR
jgi:hypothetical protein